MKSTDRIVRTVYVSNPRGWAEALVACLGADKGVSAYLEEGYHEGSWRVVADDGQVVLVKPKPEGEAFADVCNAYWSR